MSADRANQKPQTDVKDESGEDDETQASTDAYSEYESFATYKDKVIQLCGRLWPTSQEPVIQRLKGGASNRIISILVTDSEMDRSPAATSNADIENSPNLDPSLPEERVTLKASGFNADNDIDQQRSATDSEGNVRKTEKLDLPPGDFVLRIPRWGSDSCSHEVAMLRFVGKRISVAVPTIVHYDTSRDNPLGSAYILQRRVRGKRLIDTWKTLRSNQRLMICLDIARLYTELMKITNTSGGIPDVEQGSTADGTLSTSDFRFPGDDKDLRKNLDPQPPVDMLCERLTRWGNKYPRPGGSSPYHSATKMIRYMQATNHTFGADGIPLYYFNHGDLFPRNIMIETLSENAAFVTGILDWDDAHFAPAVVSFSPPAWLWMTGYWKDYGAEGCLGEEDLWKAAETEPKDETSKEIKALFDRIVGPQFLQYSYSPDAAPARKIWKSAYETIGQSWVENEVKRLYVCWENGQARADQIE